MRRPVERPSAARALVAAGLMLLVCALLALGAAVPSIGASMTGEAGVRRGLVPFGGGLIDQQLLGLCSHDFATGLKAKAPASEWPYVRNVRLNFTWKDIEGAGKGNFNWAAADNQVNAALSLGVNHIMVTLGGPCPDWATDYSIPGYSAMGPPSNLNNWYDFTYAVANRYKGYVDFYQMWQEPGWDADSPPAKEGVVYFNGRCDFQYMGLLRSGYNAVKAADPTSYVMSGAMLNGITRTPNDFFNYQVLLAGENQDFSMKVESNQDIVAERPMYFNYHGAWKGGHDESGIAKPLTTWYLAEGATHPGFEEWICLQNPGDKDAVVTITYMFAGGVTKNQAVPVKAHSRYTVDVNAAVGPDRDVSAKVVSDQPIVVERPIYFNYRPGKLNWPGGSIEAAVPELSKTWYLAEGTTRNGFEEWISLQNPGATAADVTVTYMFLGGGTQTQQLKMPPTSRSTIEVNKIVGDDKDVSAMIESTQPIIAERPMYFDYHGAWKGGHTQTGATSPASSWFLSEGTTRNNSVDGAFEEWISIQNPGSTDARVNLTYMFPGGGTQPGSITVPAHARETVSVNKEVGKDRDVSVKLDSDAPIIVERPMYFNYHNTKDGGDVEIGSQQAGKAWYFAEGTTREGFEEWLTLQNPSASAATATITFMFGDGTTQKKPVSLPPNSRTTVSINNAVSIATICDGLAVHPYDYPQYWAQYYNTVRGIMDRSGFPGTELAVTEIGWPHSGRAEFSIEGQRAAIGEQGVGALWGAGCRKIWVYEDVDDPPGTSWDAADNGLFLFNGQATPAWNEYKKWQSKLLDYGNKPSRLPFATDVGSSE